VARAQQPAVPVIGFLSPQSAEDYYKYLAIPFHQSLREAGYVEGQNVAAEYRYADNQFDRLPALAADLVRRRVAVIVANGAGRSGQAWSGRQPRAAGRQHDGHQFSDLEVVAKRLGLLHEMVPRAVRVGVLLNPTNSTARDRPDALFVTAGRA
jgi:putative ABC transport system substrate-binding protein